MSPSRDLIVGCYTLDLYCGAEDCRRYYQPAQFTGRTETPCLKQARREGWLVRKRHNGETHDHVRCPDCRRSPK